MPVFIVCRTTENATANRPPPGKHDGINIKSPSDAQQFFYRAMCAAARRAIVCFLKAGQKNTRLTDDRRVLYCFIGQKNAVSTRE